MNKNDIDKSFVSLYDEFLANFDATHEKSASQLKEIGKYQRIFALRDGQEKTDEETIWKGF